LKTIREGQGVPVAQDGFVLVPGWLDRRGDTRVLRNDPVDVTIGTERRAAFLTDASQTGFGLKFAPGLSIGQLVQVHLKGRETVGAVVVWAERDRAGLRLVHPLAPGDPLLKRSPLERLE
jgi:hypothetical protein